MALYSDKVMDHFQHPRNVGKLPDADGVGEVGNAKCGDIMRMYIQVDPETQVITDVKFNTFGCGSAIATSSMATEMIKGKPVSEALQLTNQQLPFDLQSYQQEKDGHQPVIDELDHPQILSAMRKQIKITDLQMKFMQKELLINRSNRRIGYDSSRYCRYKQKDTRRNIH